MKTSLRIYSYSGCSTCRKALKWLGDNKVAYDLEDIVQNPPSKDLLKEAINQLGSTKPLFNTSGISYRALGSETVRAMTNNEAIEALASDGKLIKRPFLKTRSGEILVGFKPDVWSVILLD